MPDQIFTVEILETWASKKKVRAASRIDALAKVKADMLSSGRKLNYYEPEDQEEMEIRSVDVRLEWPDGNPVDIKEGS